MVLIGNAKGSFRVRVGRVNDSLAQAETRSQKRLTVRERYLLTTRRKLCERTSPKAQAAAVLVRKLGNHRVRGIPSGNYLRVYCSKGSDDMADMNAEAQREKEKAFLAHQMKPEGPYRKGHVQVVSQEGGTGYVVEDGTGYRYALARRWLPTFNQLKTGSTVQFKLNGHNTVAELKLA